MFEFIQIDGAVANTASVITATECHVTLLWFILLFQHVCIHIYLLHFVKIDFKGKLAHNYAWILSKFLEIFCV